MSRAAPGLRLRAPSLVGAVLAGQLAVGGCIATVPHAEPQVMADAQPVFPTLTPAELEQDRELYVANCRGCHTLPAGRREAVDAWPEILEEMREEEVSLDDAEAPRILRYLQVARLHWEGERSRRQDARDARRAERLRRRDGSRAR